MVKKKVKNKGEAFYKKLFSSILKKGAISECHSLNGTITLNAKE
jgi:hypothetical protein